MKTTTKKFQWQKFSPKSLDFMKESTKWINIAVGSIRSSKTITVLVRFIEYMIKSPHTEFMLIGKTLNTIERNVLKPLIEMLNSLGIKAEYNGYTHELYFLDNTLALFGAGKKGDDEKIQGSTFGGAFIDEGTVITEDSFTMIISRNSLPNSEIFITCNPANPNHYLYKRYICNEDLKESGKVLIYQFMLEDNLSLTKEYIENLKASYPEGSLFYKRYILGLWVSGQGAIYPYITDENFYDTDKPLTWFDYVEFGSDYGASSTTCWNLIGIKEYSDHNEFYIIDEGGYNAEQEGRSVSDSEIVDMICMMQDKYHLGNDNIFYPSHDATSLEAELTNDERIRLRLKKFTPDTLECINTISNLFYKNYIHIHTRCKITVECLQSYEWDSNASRRGEDKPLKDEDHYCDSIRAPIMNHLWEEPVELSEIVFV